MRIIGGEHSSRRLVTLDGEKTRPTLDKVKEAVFSSLGGTFVGGNVLDLYAGSGAIGLEALSRGFDKAIFVDANRAAINIINKNIASLKYEDRCQVLNVKDLKALELLVNNKFDLIYLDPPYHHRQDDKVLAFIDEHEMLNNGGQLVIESLKEESYIAEYKHMAYVKEKIYGITKITYYKYI